jgi:phage gpG-like protein
MALCSINLEFPRIRKKQEKIKSKLPGLIAATLQTQRAMIFDKEGAYHGREKWAPLKYRVGQILKDTGTLSKSIAPQNDGINPARNQGTIVKLSLGIVTIGTNIAYAAVHDDGSEKRNIPQRQFGNITGADAINLYETVENYITYTINEG